MASVTPPVTSPETRLAYSDPYGPVWTDADGYLYRAKPNAAFAKRIADLLAQTPPVTDWQDFGEYYRTQVNDPTYRNSFWQLTQYVATGIGPVVPSQTTIGLSGATIAAAAVLVLLLKR